MHCAVSSVPIEIAVSQLEDCILPHSNALVKRGGSYHKPTLTFQFYIDSDVPSFVVFSSVVVVVDQN